MDKTYCVYKHTSPSGKVYIGMTGQKLKYRFDNGNGYINNPHFYAAIQKYGWDKIKHEIISDNLTRDSAMTLERECILEAKSYDSRFGYNMTFGGETGCKQTDYVKKTISEKLKQYYSVEANRAKAAERARGHTHSEKTKKKMSESHKKRMTPELREHYRKIMLGRKFPNKKGHKQSEESKRKISKANKGKVLNPNGRPPRPVICVETGIIYRGVNEASIAVNGEKTSIFKCCNGQRKTAHGYTWRYAS